MRRTIFCFLALALCAWFVSCSAEDDADVNKSSDFSSLVMAYVGGPYTGEWYAGTANALSTNKWYAMYDDVSERPIDGRPTVHFTVGDPYAAESKMPSLPCDYLCTLLGDSLARPYVVHPEPLLLMYRYMGISSETLIATVECPPYEFTVTDGLGRDRQVTVVFNNGTAVGSQLFGTLDLFLSITDMKLDGRAQHHFDEHTVLVLHAVRDKQKE